MRMLAAVFLFFILTLPSGALSAEKGMTIKSMRFFSYPAFTRVVFELESPAPYVLNRAGDNKSMFFTAYNMPMAVKAPLPAINDGVVNGLELGQEGGRTVLVIRMQYAAAEVKDFVLRAPDRIVLDISRGGSPSPSPAEQKQSLPTIVLDPGHGGTDTGVYSAHGLEKAFTLEVALAVKKNLQKGQRFNVVLTREKDQVLSLDERAAISNAAGALLFVSIHGGAGDISRVFIQEMIDDPGAQSRRSANSDFLRFEAGQQQGALWGKQQALHLRQSAELGRELARQRTNDKGTTGPLTAPLAGLKAVDCAAAMVEIGMSLDKQKAAEAVAQGIEQYAGQGR